MKNENCFPHAEKARRALLEAALPEAAFEGWSAKTLAHAAREAGLSEGEVQLYCPDGVIDLIRAWSRIADEDARVMIEEGPTPNRIRDKISAAIMIRLDQLAGEEEAAERARARLLLPDGLSRASVMTWETCDMIWRAIGDTSTDANFYSKRATLSAVYLSVLSQWLQENDPAKPRTRAYLDRRIDNVMQIEKAKAQVRKVQSSLPDLPAFAAKLRYGFGRRV